MLAKLKIPLAAIAAAFILSGAPGGAEEAESAVEPALGAASWYGAKLHGRTTASGEPFDMFDLTAAHPTLPFGARVRVTNLVNGKSVVVRINDRGPFHPGRIIDLSRKAAQVIGMLDRGVARVKIEPATGA